MAAKIHNGGKKLTKFVNIPISNQLINVENSISIVKITYIILSVHILYQQIKIAIFLTYFKPFKPKNTNFHGDSCICQNAFFKGKYLQIPMCT